MPKTHFLRDLAHGTYFRTCPGPHPYLPDAKTKAEADIYEHQDALTIAVAYYGTQWLAKCEVIEATASEHASWRCRRAGSVSSPRKTKNARRNARNGAGRPKNRICKACGERMDSGTPSNVHTHEVCP